MMAHLGNSSNGVEWIDCVHPTDEELQLLVSRYGIPVGVLQDCLDPEHLPKYEKLGPLQFLILRAHDESATREADTVQELTRKIAVFVSDSRVITVHRKDQPFLRELREKWSGEEASSGSVSGLLMALFEEVIHSYALPIEQATDELDRLEMGVFGAQGARPFKVQQGYYLKRKAFIFKRMLKMVIELPAKLSGAVALDSRRLQELKESDEKLAFATDNLTESVTSLMNLHISLSSQRTNEASHRTNEVVRVLTIFSVFLLPLNVLTGIYGMNFEFMPELKWQYGYPAVLLTMVSVTLVVYFWFRRKGWLR